jgi:beta-glucosidase
MDKYKSEFPANFFWGASTASHQVEGDNHNQWSVWEEAKAKDLATSAHQRLSWIPGWRDIKTQAEDPNNYISGKGVEHYKRYEEDFDIAKSLNLNSFRFGIEWSRLEPEEGKWNEAEVEHYHNYIKGLRARGIEPFMNLWHWTVPVWFEEKGGFKKRRNLKYFVRFVQKVADEYADDLSYVITLNEPNVYTIFSFYKGEWPPQEKSTLRSLLVYWNLVRAHKAAYRVLKKRKPSLMIGVASQLANIQAKRPHNLWDEMTTKLMRFSWNWWFLNRIKNQQDFIGFNYYFTDYYKHFKRDNPRVPLNDLGWYMEPEGLYPLLLRTWAHYKKPIIVTENGVADSEDQYRQWWLEETIIAMERALSEGVMLTGYFHWSLIDNFEWAYGWWPKFGLVAVDREHGMKRTVRPSAKWYGRYIKEVQDRN